MKSDKSYILCIKQKKSLITLNLSSNLIGNINDETNFPYKLLLTDTQVSKICKAFANGSSANIKFSKTQLSKIQSGGFMFSLPSDIICNKRIIPLVR